MYFFFFLVFYYTEYTRWHYVILISSADDHTAKFIYIWNIIDTRRGFEILNPPQLHQVP